MNAPLAATALEPLDARRLPMRVAIRAAGGRLLGDEAFRLVSFQGQESISEPFEYQLELHANTRATDRPDLDFNAILGRPVSVALNLPEPDGGERFQRALGGAEDPDLSLFHGIAAAFSLEQPGVYRLTLRPALWKLSLANAYQAYAGKTLREAVSEVLDRHHVEHVYIDTVESAHDPSQVRHQDWLQAGESDLEFVRRLLAKGRLFYFFRHRGDGHRMVIAGVADAYADLPAHRRLLRYTHTGVDPLGLEQEDLITRYGYRQSLASSHVEAVYARQQAVWEADGVAGFQTYPARGGGGGDLPFRQYKVYPYPISDQEIRYLTDNAGRALETSRGQLTGGSRCSLFRAGHVFRMTGAVMADSQPMPVRPGLENRDYVISRVSHQASLDGGYENDFEAVEKAPLAPFSLQDTQQGAVLGRVVSHDEGHAPKDWRYYPRDVYDLETTPEKDDLAPPALAAKGVLVHLATQGEKETGIWARIPASMPTIPEIGAMVLVSRGNDEAELPEIQNILSSGGNLDITPGGWAARSNVGNSYNTGWGDSKRISCGEKSPDCLDEARRIVEDAYATGDYKEASYNRGASYGYSTSEKGRDGLLSRSVSLGCTESRHNGKEVKSWSDVGYSYSESRTGDSDRVDEITGTSSSKSTVNISRNVSSTTTSSNQSTVGMHDESSATGMVSSASVTGMRNGASLTGMVNEVSAVGVSSSVNLAGVVTSVGATGMVNSANATGMSNGASLTGSSNQFSLTGSSSSLSIVGEQTELVVVGTKTQLNIVGQVNNIGVDETVIDINLGGALVLHLDGAVMKLHVPGFDLTIENGVGMTL